MGGIGVLMYPVEELPAKNAKKRKDRKESLRPLLVLASLRATFLQLQKLRKLFLSN